MPSCLAISSIEIYGFVALSIFIFSLTLLIWSNCCW